MDPATLIAGIAWDFETFPEYLDVGPPARDGAQLHRVRRALRAAALRDGRRGVRARGDARRDRAACASSCARRSAAGAAGFSTSFSFAHRGVDGKPVPSRFAERDEVEALFLAAGEAGKGVVLITPGEQCTLRRRVRVAAARRAAVHLPAVRGAGRQAPRAGRAARGGPGARRAGVAAGHAAAAHDAVHDGRRVQPQHRAGVRRADEGEPRGAPRGVPRSRRGGRWRRPTSRSRR